VVYDSLNDYKPCASVIGMTQGVYSMDYANKSNKIAFGGGEGVAYVMNFAKWGRRVRRRLLKDVIIYVGLQFNYLIICVKVLLFLQDCCCSLFMRKYCKFCNK